MSRHISAEKLACLDLDAFSARKTRRLRAHLATCILCTRLSHQLTTVSATLASTSYPPMPELLTVRIQAIIAAESTQRVASEPATEAGRRDLPARDRRARQARSGWHLPRMSVLGTRLVATAGALVLVGVGGYEIASHATSNQSGTSASSSGSAAAPAVGPVSAGPDVRYGQSATSKSVHTVTSDTNFTAAGLGSQAVIALHEAPGASGSGSGTRAAPSTQANSAASGTAGVGTTAPSQLSSCLDGIAGNRSVLLVEQAKYEGRPATIIITAQTGTQKAEVWAVGPSCTASHRDVLNHLTLSHI